MKYEGFVDDEKTSRMLWKAVKACNIEENLDILILTTH